MISWKPCRIATLGAVDVSMTVGIIGSGKGPKVSVTSLLHGNETAGILALENFVSNLPPTDSFRGTLQIIPVTNPLASISLTRRSYVDMADFNRMGVGNLDGSVSEKIVWNVFHIIKDSDFIINLHEFESKSPLTGVFAPGGDDMTREKTLKGLVAFDPDIIWSINPQGISGNLVSFDIGSMLKGVSSFAVEFPRADLMGNNEIEKFSNRLNRFLCYCGVTEGVFKLGRIPRSFNRSVRYSEHLGIWKPRRDLMHHVEEDELVGEIVTLPNMETKRISSTHEGQLLSIRPEEVVKVDDVLFATGKPDRELDALTQRIYQDMSLE